MKKISCLVSVLKSIRVLKTIWFNFRAFSFRDALKLPVIIKQNVEIIHIGHIVLSTKPIRGMMTVGGGNIKGAGKTRFCNNGTIVLNSGKVILCQGCILENYGVIEFMGPSFVSENTKMLIREKLIMGSHTRIGFNSCIMDSNDHFLVDMITHTIKSMTSPIVIGNWNWLGCYTFVKKGTKTPDFLITSAPYAVLCKDYCNLTKGSVVGGIPAKLISETNQRIIYNSSHEDIIRKWFFAHPEANEISLDIITNDIEQFCS